MEACFTVICLRHLERMYGASTTSSPTHEGEGGAAVHNRHWDDALASKQSVDTFAQRRGTLRKVRKLTQHQEQEHGDWLGHAVRAVLAASLAMLLRPTSAAFWIPIGAPCSRVLCWSTHVNN